MKWLLKWVPCFLLGAKKNRQLSDNCEIYIVVKYNLWKRISSRWRHVYYSFNRGESHRDMSPIASRRATSYRNSSSLMKLPSLIKLNLSHMEQNLYVSSLSLVVLFCFVQSQLATSTANTLKGEVQNLQDYH